MVREIGQTIDSTTAVVIFPEGRLFRPDRLERAKARLALENPERAARLAPLASRPATTPRRRPRAHQHHRRRRGRHRPPRTRPLRDRSPNSPKRSRSTARSASPHGESHESRSRTVTSNASPGSTNSGCSSTSGSRPATEFMCPFSMVAARRAVSRSNQARADTTHTGPGNAETSVTSRFTRPRVRSGRVDRRRARQALRRRGRARWRELRGRAGRDRRVPRSQRRREDHHDAGDHGAGRARRWNGHLERPAGRCRRATAVRLHAGRARHVPADEGPRSPRLLRHDVRPARRGRCGRRRVARAPRSGRSCRRHGAEPVEREPAAGPVGPGVDQRARPAGARRAVLRSRPDRGRDAERRAASAGEPVAWRCC